MPTTPLRFGIVFANTALRADPAQAAAVARMAERIGYESVWTVEHVVIPSDYRSPYPYAASGRMPGGEDASIPDPLVWLAYVAAATERLMLGTGILIVPQRNPLILAKELATLDQLSGGRVLLGVGAGWLQEEFDALGVPFADRGVRLEEHIAAMRALWAEDEASYDGRLVSFSRVRSNPKPVRRSVPVIVGGHSDLAARRAGRIGDGFFPGITDIDEIGRLVQVMRRSAEAEGRDPDAVEVTGGGALDPAGVERLARAGVTRVLVPPIGRSAEELERFLEKIFGDLAAVGA